MKILSFYFLTSLMAAICMGEILLPATDQFLIPSKHALEPMDPGFSSLFLQILNAHEAHFNKRDALQDNLESLLRSLQNSGVILNVLHAIANSTDEMNTLSSYIFQALVSISSNQVISGSNVTVNVTDLIDRVESSGIITSTLSGLLLDQTQREIFTDNLGEVLVNNTWISKLVLSIGETGQLRWSTIFNLARNTQSKDPGFNGTSYTYKNSRLLKRDDSSSSNYTGSFSSFFNNIIGSVIGSDLASSSLDSVLAAIKGSGIVVPTVQEVLADQAIQRMVAFIANKLYNYGVFDQIPINDYFQKVKKSGLVSDTLQKSFSDDLQSQVIGSMLYRLEQNGVFAQMQRNLYGPS